MVKKVIVGKLASKKVNPKKAEAQKKIAANVAKKEAAAKVKAEKVAAAKKADLAKKASAKAARETKAARAKAPKFHMTTRQKRYVYLSKKRALKAKEATQEAMKVEKVATKGQTATKKKIRTTPAFHRPHTLRLERKPRYQRKSFHESNKMDEFQVIKHPLTTETAIKKIEESNTLVFICDTRANKAQIAQAVKKLYKLKAEKVNTLITPLGQKKAFIKLHKSTDALDAASSIGIL